MNKFSNFKIHRRIYSHCLQTIIVLARLSALYFLCCIG